MREMLKQALPILVFSFCTVLGRSPSVLYPKPSESREVVSLDGIWDFSLSIGDDLTKENFARVFQGSETIPMPVPASYNDVIGNKTIRDYVGVVWYQRKFFVPESWVNGKRVWIRFGSVCYAAQVWVNDVLVTSHEIGHLPFQEEVSSVLLYGAENVITVAVDNRLLPTTVPQGALVDLDLGDRVIQTQTYTFDFFNYAGIDRSVYLFATPKVFISDVSVSSTLDADNQNAEVSYSVEYLGTVENGTATCVVSLIDKEGTVVSNETNCEGKLNVSSPKLWWPYLMDPAPGYQYSLKIELSADGVKDVYRQAFGIRSLTYTNTSVLINGKPIYIRGFGRHEDSDIRGKGLDLPLIVKDYSLMEWIGANAYRTSHYPYAEEIMDMADERGIMIIDECPGVNTEIFSDALKEAHKTSLTELIRRDKNRPSVIMWSISNEPRTQYPESEQYFRDIVAHVKTLDTSRPVTLAQTTVPADDFSAQFCDVVSFNRYNSWYANAGRTETIVHYVIKEAEDWYLKTNKPILVTEYGADTVPGLHALPEFMWSEEYQDVMLEEHFKAFDILRARGYFIGEMIWNFADFMTAQTIIRVGGNRKGIFTRERQPKGSAHLLRKRYWKLAQELDNAQIPADLFPYVTSN